MTPTTTTRKRRPVADPTVTDVAPPDADVAPADANGSTPPPAPPVLASLPVSSLRPGPHNPRSDLGDLEGLAASIRALGILEPLVVEQVGPTEYVVLAGHRRLAAAKLAELTEVPCVCRTRASTEAERMEMALVENLQREDLQPLDEAKGYALLVKLGLSQRAIADRVGCSQSHVSKRLALLELPSHVRARVAKGTLPLEAAAALVKLVGHPEKLKAAAGADPSRIGQEVERAEKVIEWEAKRDELVAVAKGKGWPVISEPAWNAKKSFATLAHWNGPPELDLDAKKHEAEPCHGVMIPDDPPHWYSVGRPTATSVCTEPARHGPKGPSSLKAKGKATQKRQPAEWEVKEARDRLDRKAAAEARAVVLAGAVAAYKPPARPTIELTMVLRSSLGRMMGWADPQVAGELLGLEAPDNGSKNWYPVIEDFVGQGLAQTHRAALALALAGVELQLRSNYGGFGGDDVAQHFAYLAELGYQPSPWEQQKLDEAAKTD